MKVETGQEAAARQSEDIKSDLSFFTIVLLVFGGVTLLVGSFLIFNIFNITIAQPLAHDYANRFRGLDDTELDALADSFAFKACAVREPLLAELQRNLAAGAAR